MSARLAPSVLLVSAFALTLTVAGCAPPAPPKATGDAAKAASATSVQDLGGMDALVAAAKKEGQLNVIALPPDWANYGEMISTFSEKYGITVNSDQPDATSQDEIDAAKRLGTDPRAPDVFDLGQAVALANTDLFASYEVSTWDDVPEENKAEDGGWINDYGGFMSIGYDSAKVPEPTGVNDLLKPEYKGAVALNGDPTTASAAFSGVLMASLSNDGSADDLAPGVDFFSRLKQAGNFLPVDPTPALITSGQTPVVIDWDYTNAGVTEQLPTWKVVVPTDALTASYYHQAVSKNAPHPAAARLWQEFVFSDEGQNIWLAGGARPIRAEAMEKAGTLDEAASGALPDVEGKPVILTPEQAEAGAQYLSGAWAAAVS